MGPAVSASWPLLAYGPAASLIRRPAQDTAQNCKLVGEKARRKEARQIICRSASPSSILSQLLVSMNQPQMSCPRISQMNADGENHRDDPLMVRSADSAILEVAIRWSSGFSRLPDSPEVGERGRGRPLSDTRVLIPAGAESLSK